MALCTNTCETTSKLCIPNGMNLLLFIERMVQVLNRIIIQGRMTKDPELRHTRSGAAVASFSLAVDRDFKDKQTGEKATDFIDIVAWRQTAEFVSRFFTKGRMAVVEGRLQIRDWTDRDGGKRRSAEVIADNVYFGDSKRDGGPGEGYSGGEPSAPAPSTGRAAPAGPSGNEFGDLTDDDGELPF